MHLTVVIHQDTAEYWSEITELPGCFASGRTLTELHEALAEAVGIYLWDLPATVDPLDLTVGVNEVEARPGGRPADESR